MSRGFLLTVLDMVISNDYFMVMVQMTVTEFKAHALETIKRVNQRQEPVILTKRGKPVAELRPYREASDSPAPGRLAHTLVSMGDIVRPLDADDWEAAQ